MKCPVCKKNISETDLHCPNCGARTGLVCSVCSTINPIGNFECKNCATPLLKTCPHCNSVNFPDAINCRKCGSGLNNIKKSKKNKKAKTINHNLLKYSPVFYTRKEAFEALTEGILSTEKKIFSISGERGIGKTYLLKKVQEKLKSENFKWCIGKCTPTTQVTPGGVVQDMLLNLFNLPNFCVIDDEVKKDAISFFSKEFRFLNTNEISEFFNFLYNTEIGNFEDIVINKKRTFSILSKVFEAFNATGKFIFVIDNFDFIDGFSAEIFNNFLKKESNLKNLKFICLYNEYRPISGFFSFQDREIKSYLDISLAPMNTKEFVQMIKDYGEITQYISKREFEVIFEKSQGNSAFIEQAISYCFDCQINDKTFILPENFQKLISERLKILKTNNQEAFKFLCGSAILGDKLNFSLLKEIFSYNPTEFNEIVVYLIKSNFIKTVDEDKYEFNNLLLWETVLKNVTKSSYFSDINIKIGKTISRFSINTNPAMAMIAHNLRENRMAFDIWTKITRFASYIGDINLYVISQKQCLALLNEFNDNETLDIRYNISERLGKLLTEYDPKEALEYLPDAISNAKASNNEVKEIDLLGYLAKCCLKTENYYGNIECVDNVLKKLKPAQELESALIKSSKLPSLLHIGNCAEAVNMIDNDILPILNKFLAKPKLTNTIPLNMIYDSWVRTYIALSCALALQGNNRAFEILSKVFDILEKHRINDMNLICVSKLILAYANTMKGDFYSSYAQLDDIDKHYKDNIDNPQIISYLNLIYAINKIMLKDYTDIKEILFDSVTFANNIGDEFGKNILKVFLGKVFQDDKQAKHAVKIYDEQVNYFAKEKYALGALLTWYLISDATIITENPKNAIDIANQALEISKNPKINNYFFTVKLNIVLAKAFNELSDYETAKIHLETALNIAKKYEMSDLLSEIYLMYGKYYYELGTVNSTSQQQYLKTSSKMYEKATEIVVKYTRNTYIKSLIENKKEILNQFCEQNGVKL